MLINLICCSEKSHTTIDYYCEMDTSTSIAYVVLTILGLPGTTNMLYYKLSCSLILVINLLQNNCSLNI